MNKKNMVEFPLSTVAIFCVHFYISYSFCFQPEMLSKVSMGRQKVQNIIKLRYNHQRCKVLQKIDSIFALDDNDDEGYICIIMSPSTSQEKTDRIDVNISLCSDIQQDGKELGNAEGLIIDFRWNVKDVDIKWYVKNKLLVLCFDHDSKSYLESKRKLI